MSDRPMQSVPRYSLTRSEAAQSIGVSLTTFKTKIAPELRVVRRGAVRLYPTRDIEQWVDENAERVIEG